MEVSNVYNAHASTVFDFLIKLFIEDFKQNTSKDIEPEQIVPGLKYTKVFKTHHQVQVEVLEVSAPHIYKVQITSSRGRQVIHYDLKEISEGQLQIVYRELNEPSGFFGTWNYKILRFFLKKRLERRMLLQIDKLVEFSTTDTSIQ
ncbi:DUF3284 domain-containing protein [Streptococcus ovis]|uniref:DUF3284 domain-containing protein n=1 Tax=Streptococcus ovis TaxID=82806 RepID=UPI0003752DB3|nr:DUF3284 domain-containing protein [Streptococcus ovis]